MVGSGEGIVVQLQGGLGNQMFQYALGRRLSLERAVPLKIDPGGIFRLPGRSYRLDNFNICVDGIVAPHERASANVVQERNFIFDAAVLDVPCPVYLEGYWQNEQYFNTIADVVRSNFQLLRPMSLHRQELVEQMRKGTSISLHVRRGDYLRPDVLEILGVVAPEWYRAAMERISEGVDNPQFFVFSNDPAWTRANLPSAWPITFVDPSSDGRDYEDMHLMARCRHHVIANSTFSWWAAWLNPDPDKRVVAPARWFNIEMPAKQSIVPAAWTKL